MSESLRLGHNPHSVGWCVERLKRRAITPMNKQNLMLFQNLGAYYSCAVVKKNDDINTALKNDKAMELYKQTGAPGTFKYLLEHHDYRIPAWLSLRLMGSVNLKGV